MYIVSRVCCIVHVWVCVCLCVCVFVFVGVCLCICVFAFVYVLVCVFVCSVFVCDILSRAIILYILYSIQYIVDLIARYLFCMSHVNRARDLYIPIYQYIYKYVSHIYLYMYICIYL